MGAVKETVWLWGPGKASLPWTPGVTSTVTTTSLTVLQTCVPVQQEEEQQQETPGPSPHSVPGWGPGLPALVWPPGVTTTVSHRTPSVQPRSVSAGSCPVLQLLTVLIILSFSQIDTLLNN